MAPDYPWLRGVRDRDCREPDDGARVDNHDPIHKPAHYVRDGMECYEALKAMAPANAWKWYCCLTAVSYIWRHEGKGGSVDLSKACVYLGWALEAADGEEDSG